ncbi:dipeptide ABC transporter ATP-binding protein [Psychrilyobacter sp.]|uniref:ABC transporter ATP-binding protein n=1 Tax=Psychrilyobacter sp. TaxID=2586924 RepID=UPI003019EE4B
MKEVILKLEGIHKKFIITKKKFGKKATFVHALNNVSLEVYKGETLAIVGESGCGKSTLGRVANKILDVEKGNVYFNGNNITHLSSKEMLKHRKKMQVIFQDPYGSLNPRLKIKDLIGEPLLVHSDMNKNQREKKVKELLNIVGLSEEHLTRYPHEFSGGQRQRVGIARALSVNPSLIIADEPISALDVSIQAQILNIFKELQRKYDLTYIFISHDLSVVEMIADRIGVMYLGKLVEIADKNNLYSSPMHPYTKALLSAIPVIDPTKKKKRIILKGDIPNPINLPTGCPFSTRCPQVLDVCKDKMPELIKLSDSHSVACHLIKKIK